MQNIAKKPTNEHELLAMFQDYKREPTTALRNQLVVQYLHIARIIAFRFSKKGVDFDDLYQVASLSLIKAVERFDPDYGVKFQSFATPKMVGEVKNYFRDKLHMLNLPRRGARLSAQLDIARAELAQQLLRQPTMSELVEYTELPETEVVEALAMRGAMYPTSLDMQPDEESNTTIGSLIGEEEVEFGRFELSETMGHILSELPEIEQQILRARYWENKSQREVAEYLGVSQMTVSRAERKALAKVKARYHDN